MQPILMMGELNGGSALNSWKDRTDLGLEVVASVSDALKVEPEWSVDNGRGYTWWADDFAQHVWAEESVFQTSLPIYRVHAETDLLFGRGRAERFELGLMSAMRDTQLSGVVYDHDKDIFRLHCSVYAHLDNAGWIKRLFASACALQIDEAHDIGHELAKKLVASAAVSQHPAHGLRSHASPVLQAAKNFFIPQGAGQSRWVDDPEWQKLGWAMDREAREYKCDQRSQLTAALDWPHSPYPARLDVSANETNPMLGHGLTYRLKLPVNYSHEQCAHKALELNNVERSQWMRCHFLGSWCFDHGVLEFECFIPNTSYSPNLMVDLATCMCVRTQWVSEHMFQGPKTS